MYKCTIGSLEFFVEKPFWELVKEAPPVVPTSPPVLELTAAQPARFFAANSFWYTPLPAQVQLHPNSANFASDIVRQIAAYYQTVNINTWEFAAPVYIVGKDVKPVKVNYSNCQKKDWLDPAFIDMISAVPIPANATPAKGTDKEMCIYQPSTDTLWELWVAEKDASGAWSACWGGKLENASKSDGRFKQYYGTTATSLPFVGGQITAEELAAGEIKHVMGISLVDLENWDIVSWPASRSDGWNPDKAKNRIAEGQRFRLDPTIDVSKLPLGKAGKIIAKAAQIYGFVVWDHAGAISLRAQNPMCYTAQGKADPYPALFENKASYDVLKGLPWDRMQFLPMNYGKP